MTTTTLTSPPEQQGVHEHAQGLITAGRQAHPYRAPRPPAEELDAFRGLLDGLVLALAFWLVAAVLIAML
jgi:hypothetical protein